MQVTDDETRVEEMFFIPPPKYGRAFCILFVTLSGLSLKRDRQEAYVVFSGGFMAGEIAAYEL